MDRRVQVVITLMEERFYRDLSLEEMAQSVNLSSSRFRHLFKAETGTTPVHHLKLLRIRRAGELVESTFLSMKEVMNRVGVRDKRHFTEDFKRVYGLTPARYRANGHNPDFVTGHARNNGSRMRYQTAVSATK